VSEARSIGGHGEENAPRRKARRPAEANRGVVKRRILRGRSTNSRAHEARVLVVNVLGSRRRSDVSRDLRHGEPQGKPRGKR
jgi:hypothetical protein